MIFHKIKPKKKTRFGVVFQQLPKPGPSAATHVEYAQPTEGTQPRGPKQVNHCDFTLMMPAEILCMDAGIAIARDGSRAQLIRLPNARELRPFTPIEWRRV